MLSPLMKFRIKRLLGALGIRLRPGNTGHRDLLAFLRHIRTLGFHPGTVFDVGVADGTIELYTTFPEARHVLIEAMVEFQPVLEYLRRRYNAIYEIAAAGAADSEIQVAYSNDLHAASTLPVEQTDAGAMARRTVPLFRLDTLAEKHQVEGPFLVKIDTQGSELTVLEGATRVLEDTEVVILEVSLFRFDARTPVLGEVVAFMEERGFTPYDLFDGHGRPLDGALAQIDMAFVKTDGRFRTSHRYISDEQAAAYRNSLLARLRRTLRV